MTEPTPFDASTPSRWAASSEHPDMWVDPKDDPRDSGVPLRDERATLLEYLGAYRLTLEMKCADLDAAQLASRSVPPSTMSLLGLIRHMVEVERHWFRRVMAGEDAPKRYSQNDGEDGDWAGAVAEDSVVAEAWQAWREEVAYAEGFVDRNDLDALGRTKHGDAVQLREIVVHLIEEYARHCGHADLLRERIDGRVGQ